MTAPRPRARNSAAARSLAALEADADRLRAEIAALHATLAASAGDPRPRAGDDLVAANEQLVLAVLRAQAVAGAAERHRAEALRASLHDPLTGTPNRTAMLERLRLAIASAQRRRGLFAVLFIDIDRFKRINDRHGHPVGDAVLQCIARRLLGHVRETDAVGRVGGEEFLVVLDDLASQDVVTGLVEHLLQVMAQPETIDGHAIALSASVGIAFYPDDGTSVAALVACADAAMYRAKRRGPGGYAFCRDIPRAADGAPMTCAAATAPPPDGLRDVDDPGVAHERHAAMQEANAALVVSILQAQAAETQARVAQSRQLDAMAMAAHELRNPLAPIRLATDMLGAARDDHGRFERLREIIEAQVVHIARLVDDLVDGARVSTGRLRVEHGAIELAAVLQAAVLACDPSIAARRQLLVVDLPDDDRMAMAGDHARLVQVFSNLLDNASKYTPEGGHISLVAARQADAFTVGVHDSGIGVPADTLAHIFDLFVRDPGAAAVRPGGLGIGLAIVRELVEAHGGTVTARSDGRDLGSTFAVTLPVEASATRA